MTSSKIPAILLDDRSGLGRSILPELANEGIKVTQVDSYPALIQKLDSPSGNPPCAILLGETLATGIDDGKPASAALHNGLAALAGLKQRRFTHRFDEYPQKRTPPVIMLATNGLLSALPAFERDAYQFMTAQGVNQRLDVESLAWYLTHLMESDIPSSDLEAQLKSVAVKTAREIESILTCTGVTVQLLTKNERRLVGATYTEDKISYGLLGNIASDKLIRNIVESQEPTLIPDTKADSRWKPTRKTKGVRSWLGVPLVYYGTTVGILTLDKEFPFGFDENSYSKIEPLTRRLAYALGKTHLLSVDEATEILTPITGIISKLRHDDHISWQDMVASLATQAQLILECDCCTFFRLETDSKTKQQRMIPCHDVNRPSDVKPWERRLGEGVTKGLLWQAVDSQEGLLYNDAWQHEFFEERPDIQSGQQRHLLLVPVRSYLNPKKILGVISADHIVKGTTRKYFRGSDLLLVTTLSERASSLIEKLQLDEILRRSIILPTETADPDDIAAMTEDIITKMLESALNLVDMESAVIHLFRPAPESRNPFKLFHERSIRAGEDDVPHEQPRMVPETVTYDVLSKSEQGENRSKAAFYDIRDAANDPYMKPTLKDHNIKTMIGVVLRNQTSVLAVMYFNGRHTKEFYEFAAPSLLSQCQVFATAIDNLRTYERFNRYGKLKDASNQALASIISSEGEIPILETLAQSAWLMTTSGQKAEIVKDIFVTIVLRSSDKLRIAAIHPVMVRQEYEKVVSEIDLASDNDFHIGIVGHVVKEAQEAYEPSALDAEANYPEYYLTVKVSTHSQFAVPLLDKDGKAFGAFSVEHPQKYGFTPEDKENLRLIAQVATIAYERQRTLDRALAQLEKYTKTTVDEINKNREGAKKQARLFLRLSLFSFLIGVVLVVFVVTYFFLQYPDFETGTLNVGAIAALFTAITQFMALYGTRQLNSANRRQDELQKELRKTQGLQTLIEACDVIEDDERREQAKAQVIENVATVWLTESNLIKEL